MPVHKLPENPSSFTFNMHNRDLQTLQNSVYHLIGFVFAHAVLFQEVY